MQSAMRVRRANSECVLAAKHVGASLAGFAVDFIVLHVATWSGLEPAWARVASLGAAMNVTFVLNAAFVFRCLGTGRSLFRQWLWYLASNAFGNLCNYWIFVTLVSLHHPVVSRPAVALCVAAFSAWIINYSAARLLVFGAHFRGRMAARRSRAVSRTPPADPRRGEPVSSRR
jgi:putative flippase GtrA